MCCFNKNYHDTLLLVLSQSPDHQDKDVHTQMMMEILTFVAGIAVRGDNSSVISLRVHCLGKLTATCKIIMIS